MVANKHISKIVLAVMAAAVVLCFLAIAFSGQLTELLGGKTVKMEYESKLFDTDEIISVDIQMDEDEWNKMLANATYEEYYVCDVVINGKKFSNVAIRPKGNTSLSAIAMDPDSDRFSLKLEFGHYVEGQTCWGLDKLILNNNYADATNMKEALVYDMYRYLDVEASLYNYAKVSVNGEYWGVYLALEAVEESFMLRNFGTQDGELYKPDSLEMGGGSSSGGAAASAPGGMDFGGMTPPSGGEGGFSFGGGSDEASSGGGNDEASSGGGNDEASSAGRNGGFPGGGNDEASSAGGNGGFPGGGNDEASSAGGDSAPQAGDRPESGEGGFDPDSRPDMGDFEPGDMGGFSMGGSNGANLNYTDDELDSYSLIWEGEVTGTSTADHRRVVTALKNISEGTDLETYLDVDNVLKYMAVHTFAVNMDSLSGSMSHNFYLYEYKGRLNIFPWDYNLSFGGMSNVGNSSNSATDMVNDAIDTPFSGTKFFDALLENEEYRERYHAYLQQLVDEYVFGGRFEEFYERVRSQIDPLVETDPTAFYSYEEYQTAAEILVETVQLRAQSIRGQLDGSIPSTDAGQRQDSSSLIDASHIDLSAMGQFDMGGSFSGPEKTEGEDGEAAAAPGEGGSFSPPEGFEGGEAPEGFDPGSMFGGGFGGMPDMGGFGGGAPGQSAEQTRAGNLLVFGGCLVLALAALLALRFLRRKKN